MTFAFIKAVAWRSVNLLKAYSSGDLYIILYDSTKFSEENLDLDFFWLYWEFNPLRIS